MTARGLASSPFYLTAWRNCELSTFPRSGARRAQDDGQGRGTALGVAVAGEPGAAVGETKRAISSRSRCNAVPAAGRKRLRAPLALEDTVSAAMMRARPRPQRRARPHADALQCAQNSEFAITPRLAARVEPYKAKPQTEKAAGGFQCNIR